MKSLPSLAAIAIAVTLLLTPMVSTAAGTISFTSPAAGTSFKGTQSYTIAGTVSPAPTQADNVGIVVKNPGGTTVDVANVAVSSGAFSYATATGNSVNPSLWPTGTYTITATDSFSATGSMTFAYNSGAVSFNLTRAILQIQGNLTLLKAQIKSLNASVTTLKSTQATQGNTISGLQTSLASLASAVSQLQSSVSGLVTSVGSIQTTVGGLGSQITAAANNARSAADAVSSTQTYVLVVAVLAAITLVLELAILVRKVS